MTVESVEILNTTRYQLGQPALSIDPVDFQIGWNSAFSLPVGRSLVTSGTAALADRGTVVLMNNSAGAAVFTIPPNASVLFDVGAVLALGWAAGSTQPSFAAGAGVTLVVPHAVTPFAVGSIITAWQQAANVWWIGGDTT